MKLTMRDGVKLHMRKWIPERPQAAVLLIHGMAEHIDRYDDFACFLKANGIAVYGYDQRGHGKTAGHVDGLGYFGTAGWPGVVEDCHEVVKHIKGEYPDIPLFLMGHSMGSFISRSYMHTYAGVQGLILSGTGADTGFLGRLLLGMVTISEKLRGPKAEAKLISKLTNDELLKQIKPSRTPFDWLSRDEKIVDKYIEDPYCGTVFSTSFYRGLFKTVTFVNSVRCVSVYPKSMPVFLFSGDRDPVGDYGKGVEKVKELLEVTGQEDVRLRLYKDARHECLNELNKEEVYRDILSWIEEKR